MIFESNRYRTLNNFIIPNCYSITKFTNYTLFQLLELYESNDCFMIFDNQGYFYDINSVYYLQHIDGEGGGQQLIANFNRLCEKIPQIFKMDIIDNENVLKINYNLILELKQFNQQEQKYIKNVDKVNEKKIDKYLERDENIENLLQNNIVNNSIDDKIDNIISKIKNDVLLNQTTKETKKNVEKHDDYIYLENTDSMNYDYCHIPNNQNKSQSEYIEYLKKLVEEVDCIIGFNTLGYCKYYIKSKELCDKKENCNLYIHIQKYNKLNQSVIDNSDKLKIRVYNEYLKHFDENTICNLNKQFWYNDYQYQGIYENEKYDYNLILNEIKLPSIEFNKSIFFQTQLTTSNILVNDVDNIRNHFLNIIDCNSYINCYYSKDSKESIDCKENKNIGTKYVQVFVIVHNIYTENEKYKKMLSVLIEYFNKEYINYELFLYKEDQLLNKKFFEKLQETKYVVFLDNVVHNYITNLVYECILNECFIFYHGCDQASLFFHNVKSFIPIHLTDNLLINISNVFVKSIPNLIQNDIYNNFIEDIKCNKERIYKDYNVFTKFQKLLNMEKYSKPINSIVSKTTKKVGIIFIQENDNYINKKFYEYILTKFYNMNYIYVVSDYLNEDNKVLVNDILSSHHYNSQLIIVEKSSVYQFIYDLCFCMANINVYYVENNNYHLFNSYNNMFDEFDEYQYKIENLDCYDEYMLKTNHIIVNKYNSPATYIYTNSNYYHYINPLMLKSGKDFIINKMIYEKR